MEVLLTVSNMSAVRTLQTNMLRDQACDWSVTKRGAKVSLVYQTSHPWPCDLFNFITMFESELILFVTVGMWKLQSPQLGEHRASAQ